jgi:hypothetical protein
MHNSLMVAKVVLLAVLPLLFVSCSVLRQNEADEPFEGLNAAMSRKAAGSGIIRLLVVHGMGHHNKGYADPLMGVLSDDLHLVRQNQPEPEVPIKEKEADKFCYGVVRKIVYVDTTGTVKLKVYELTWTPTVQGIKDESFANDNKLAEYRLTVNRDLKKTLIDDSISDAVLYTGQYKEHMQYPVMRAIQLIEQDGLSAHDELAIITHSLGSRMVFDTLIKMHEGKPILGDPKVNDNSRVAESVILRTKYFFMLANQLPLLALAETEKPPGDQPAVIHRSLKEFLRLHRQIRESMTKKLGREPEEMAKLHIVAFSDPNDLLSYPINKDVMLEGNPDAPEIDISNVRISIARWGWFFLLADPLKAHTGYFTDSRTVHQIANGRKK